MNSVAGREMVGAMAVEVHVTGRVELGRFGEFAAALEPWTSYRAGRGRAPVRVYQALSGRMNEIRMVFEYDDLAGYEQEEREDAVDPEYARLASAMPFGSFTSDAMASASQPSNAWNGSSAMVRSSAAVSALWSWSLTSPCLRYSAARLSRTPL